MGSDCTTHRHGDNSSNPRISELRFAATALGRDRFYHWVEVSARAAVSAVLSKDVFTLRKYQRNATHRTWLSVRFRWSCARNCERWEWLRKSSEYFAFKH